MRATNMLDLDALRAAISKCLDECETRLGRHVEMVADHYWLIEPDAAFDLSQEPVVSAGRLSDDLAEIRRLVDAHELSGSLTAWHGLGHVLGPLTRLAALLSPR